MMEFENLPNWLQWTIITAGAAAFLLFAVAVINAGLECNKKGGVFLTDSFACVERMK